MQLFQMSKGWQEIVASDHLIASGETISQERTIQEVDFLEKQFNLVKRKTILDIACENGRHSLELSRRGYQVVGVDYCESLLLLVPKTASEEGLPVRFLRADTR